MTYPSSFRYTKQYPMIRHILDIIEINFTSPHEPDLDMFYLSWVAAEHSSSRSKSNSTKLKMKSIPNGVKIIKSEFIQDGGTTDKGN